VKEQYLDPDYVPDVLPHREGEIGEVFELLKPMVEGRRATNVFLCGSAGIGKTAVGRFVMREFEEQNARGIYVNCWYHRTEVAVLTEALRQLSYPVPRKGRSVDELVEEFMQNIGGEKLVFVLDEVDALTDDGVLYVLSRARVPIGVVMISNDPYALRHLDQRVKSSLSPITVEFEKYSVEELYDILDERAKLAFREYDSMAVKVAARLSFKHNSDVRYGMNLLLRAGRLAGKMGQRVEVGHVKSVDVKEDPKKERRQGDLEGEHKLVVDALRGLGGKGTSLEVFSKYKEIGGKGAERTFRKYVKELIELQMLGQEDLPGRGKRRLLKLR
jgi:archaeal cell division control protein 6